MENIKTLSKCKLSECVSFNTAQIYFYFPKPYWDLISNDFVNFVNLAFLKIILLCHLEEDFRRQLYKFDAEILNCRSLQQKNGLHVLNFK